MTTLRTPPPVPREDSVQIGDIVYVRARVVSTEKGSPMMGQEQRFGVCAVDSDGRHVGTQTLYLMERQELITTREMRSLIELRR